MKATLGKIGMVCAIVVLSASTASSCQRTTVSGTNVAIPMRGKISTGLLNTAILHEVNYTRCRAGLPALKSESRLTNAASKHSKWMARNQHLSHKSTMSGQGTPRDRMKRTGLQFKTGSENISKMYYYQLAGQPFYVKDAGACKFTDQKGRAISQHSYATLARAAVKLWADSPKHRVNLMDQRMRVTATAVAVDPKAKHCGTIYLTQNFIG